MSEANRKKVALPILRKSMRQVGVANEGPSTSKGRHLTQLTFRQLSSEAAEADTFDEFKTSLMSVGKTADDGNDSIFTVEDLTVFKEKDILITCK